MAAAGGTTGHDRSPTPTKNALGQDGHDLATTIGGRQSSILLDSRHAKLPEGRTAATGPSLTVAAPPVMYAVGEGVVRDSGDCWESRISQMGPLGGLMARQAPK